MMADPSGHWPTWGQVGLFLAGATIIAVGVVAVVAAAPIVAAATTIGYASMVIYSAGIIACGVTAAVCGGSMIQESIMCTNSLKNSIGEDNFNALTIISTAGAVQGLSQLSSTPKSNIPVIGKMKDLDNTKLRKYEFKVADMLPDMGSPKANWKQNSSVLRSLMNGSPIRDVSPYPMQNAGFLGAERNLLMNHGYVYDNGYWIMP